MQRTTAARLALTIMVSALAACTGQVGGPPVGDRSGSSSGRPLAVRSGAPTYGVDISLWSGPITDTELDCLWDEGVRHVIAGTQNPRITRQQLDAALEAGMTVDAYVYLHWDEDMEVQVRESVALASEYPVGRLWLDVEQEPGELEVEDLERLIETAADACGSFPCGIYTGKWFWDAYMEGSEVGADLPLWYAVYDGEPSMDTWSAQQFGGWDEPWGKQFMGDGTLCGVGLDENTIHVTTAPIAEHTELPPADPSEPPARPTGLYPDDHLAIHWSVSPRPMCDAVPGATRYQFEITTWNGSSYVPYYVYETDTNAKQFSAGIADTTYRWRVRAGNASGWGPWSAWAYFEHGDAAGAPEVGDDPDDGSTGSGDGTGSGSGDDGSGSDDGSGDDGSGDDGSGGDDGTDTGDSTPSGGSGLSPDGDARITSSSVTLSCDSVDGARGYEFAIEVHDGASYVPYYTYSSDDAQQTFWPAHDDSAYRWRVRVTTASGTGTWSAWATFLFGDGASAGDGGGETGGETGGDSGSGSGTDPTSAPTGLSPDGGVLESGAVTLSCDPVAGASYYELEIEVDSGGGYGAYYTYEPAAPEKTFYPAVDAASYRWRVRAMVSGTWTPWSGWAVFEY